MWIFNWLLNPLNPLKRDVLGSACDTEGQELTKDAGAYPRAKAGLAGLSDADIAMKGAGNVGEARKYDIMNGKGNIPSLINTGGTDSLKTAPHMPSSIVPFMLSV